MKQEDIEGRLAEFFPQAEIRVKDMTGGGDHWQVSVVSGVFEGKTMVEQHQMVYQALGAWMDKEIHALSLNTSPGNS